MRNSLELDQKLSKNLTISELSNFCASFFKKILIRSSHFFYFDDSKLFCKLQNPRRNYTKIAIFIVNNIWIFFVFIKLFLFFLYVTYLYFIFILYIYYTYKF